MNRRAFLAALAAVVAAPVMPVWEVEVVDAYTTNGFWILDDSVSELGVTTRLGFGAPATWTPGELVTAEMLNRVEL